MTTHTATSFSKASIRDLSAGELLGKRVLLRVDFNVPLDEQKKVTDDARIRESMPTLKYLSDAGAKVIIMCHFGRPKGKVVESLRLDPIVSTIEKLLGKPIKKINECVGPVAEKAVGELSNGSVLLLENVRFHAEEEANDAGFAKQLAALGDLFVNDAFGAAHRAHASTAGIAAYLPAYAGFLIEKELEMLGKSLDHPARPFIAIIGGAKVSSKFGVLKHLLNKVDTLVIGGGMAYTFLKGQGKEIGKSMCEPDLINDAIQFLEAAKAKNVNVMLPVDVGVGNKFGADAQRKDVPVDQIPADWEGMDAGPQTVALIKAEISKSKTVLWNGPLGVFEFNSFATGTDAIAHAIAETKIISIIGGGDSAAAIKKAGLTDKMTHISTGGGASLEFLEGKVLPGIAVLKNK